MTSQVPNSNAPVTFMCVINKTHASPQAACREPSNSSAWSIPVSSNRHWAHLYATTTKPTPPDAESTADAGPTPGDINPSSTAAGAATTAQQQEAAGADAAAQSTASLSFDDMAEQLQQLEDQLSVEQTNVRRSPDSCRVLLHVAQRATVCDTNLPSLASLGQDAWSHRHWREAAVGHERRQRRRKISCCAAWRTWRTCASARRSRSIPTASLRCRCATSHAAGYTREHARAVTCSASVSHDIVWRVYRPAVVNRVRVPCRASRSRC